MKVGTYVSLITASLIIVLVSVSVVLKWQIEPPESSTPECAKVLNAVSASAAALEPDVRVTVLGMDGTTGWCRVVVSGR